MASLGFENVSKRFHDGTLALAQVDLDIAHGEFMVLVGPSGCGKTTLLRSAAGLEEITSGEIRLGGRVVTDVDPSERDVAISGASGTARAATRSRSCRPQGSKGDPGAVGASGTPWSPGASRPEGRFGPAGLPACRAQRVMPAPEARQGPRESRGF